MRVNLLAAQRLVSPALFEHVLAQAGPDPAPHAIIALADVTPRLFGIYSDWRSSVKATTAHRAWRNSLYPTPWPAAWVERYASRWPLAAAFANQAAEEERG